MRNEKLIELRLKNNLTQEELSEKLYVAVTKVRNWEHGKTIPSIEDMEKLAEVLNVEISTIHDIFKPYHTDSHDMELNLRKKVLMILFNDCNTAETFFEFSYLFSIERTSGIICCCDYIFHFSRIITEQGSNIVIFADSSDNYFILNDTNIKKVTPISLNFDVYTFEISTDYPMFPTGVQPLPVDFEQKIRISMFDC